MIKNDITQFWKVFEKPEGFRLFSAIKSQNVSLGFDKHGNRSLFVDIPVAVHIAKPQYILEHLSFNIEEGTRNFLIISLKDDSFSLLFDEFLFAIFSQIHEITCVEVVGEKIVKLYHEWSLFFTKKSRLNVTVKKVLGLAGELYYINRYLEVSCTAEVLESWVGPSNNRHDFIFQDYDIEVKAKLKTSNIISISSLVQLEFDKALKLGVVSFTMWDESDQCCPVSITSMIDAIIRRLRSGGIDTFLFLNKLLQIGVNFYDRDQMDKIEEIKFLICGHQEYDASHRDFPRLVSNNIPAAVKSVKYELDLNMLENFKI